MERKERALADIKFADFARAADRTINSKFTISLTDAV